MSAHKFQSEIQKVSWGRIRRAWLFVGGWPEVFAGLLAITLALSMTACSSESKPTAVREGSGASQTSIQPVNVSAPATTKVLEGTGTPLTSKPRSSRALAKKRPETMPFRDSNYGVAFRYPWQYTLKTHGELRGDDAGAPAMKFVQPGGVRVAAVEVPSSYFPNTDLDSAMFTVSLHRKMSAEECGQFAAEKKSEVEQGAKLGEASAQAAPPKAEKTAPPAKVLVGGMEALEMAEVSGQSDAAYYHVFQNGACYEFALALTTSESDDVMPVNHDKVFDRLSRILDTVELEGEATPEVTTASSANGTN
jgi:hypothetical protein